MIPAKSISRYISRKICRKITETNIRFLLAILILSAAAVMPSFGRNKTFSIQKDSVPVLNGFAVSVDIAGPIIRALSDYGEYEAALRLNIHDQYFPIVELGYGDCDHYEEVTEINYKTHAPYFRIGCDLNLLKDKHAANRLYGGLRYGFTSYNVDISRVGVTDPVWGTQSDFIVDGEKCNYHWIEAVVGLSARIWGPLHLGWNVRYRKKISGSRTSAGKAWYVPGFGKWGDTRLGANFNIIIDI